MLIFQGVPLKNFTQNQKREAGSDRIVFQSHPSFFSGYYETFMGGAFVGLSRLPGFQGQNEGLDWDPWILK